LPYHLDIDTGIDDDFLTADDLAAFDRGRARSRKGSGGEPGRKRSRLTRPPRTEADQAFKCGHCRQFIGAPVLGGRHRNHCPNCLYSRHVDGTRPGDRRSDCHALMMPVGIIARRNGEQAILHRCLGCDKEGPNRIAADDNPVSLMKLPPVSLPGPDAIPETLPAAIALADEQTA
jgi:hypothetical protein